jgi:hypothetical protein
LPWSPGNACVYIVSPSLSPFTRMSNRPMPGSEYSTDTLPPCFEAHARYLAFDGPSSDGTYLLRASKRRPDFMSTRSSDTNGGIRLAVGRAVIVMTCDCFLQRHVKFPGRNGRTRLTRRKKSTHCMKKQCLHSHSILFRVARGSMYSSCKVGVSTWAAQRTCADEWKSTGSQKQLGTRVPTHPFVYTRCIGARVPVPMYWHLRGELHWKQ